MKLPVRDPADLTLLDRFALEILPTVFNAILLQSRGVSDVETQLVAQLTYAMAQAMLIERVDYENDGNGNGDDKP